MARDEGYGATLYQRPLAAPGVTPPGRRRLLALVGLFVVAASLLGGPAASAAAERPKELRVALSEQRADGARLTVVAPPALGQDAPPPDRVELVDLATEEPLDATVERLPAAPLEVVLVADVGGGQETVDAVRGGLRDFVFSLPERSAVTIVAAGADPRLVASLTRSRDSALAGVALLAPAEPGLPEAAFDLGLDQLTGTAGTRPVVVEVRTGSYRSATSSTTALDATRERLTEEGIDVYAVHLGTGLPDLALPVPVRGGLVLEARSLPDLLGALDTVAGDLSLPRYLIEVPMDDIRGVLIRSDWRNVRSEVVTIAGPVIPPEPAEEPPPAAGPPLGELAAASGAVALVAAVVLVPPWRRRRRAAREAAQPLRSAAVAFRDGGPPPAPTPAGGVGTALGGEEVEGAAAVRALLLAGARPVRAVWLGDGLEPAVRDELDALAGERRVPVRAGRRPGATHPVAALAAPLEPVPPEALWTAGPRPVVVALAGTPSPPELGGALQVAGAAREGGRGLAGVLLLRQPSSRITPAAAAAAGGAVEQLPLALVADLGAALASARAAGMRVVGVVGAGAGPEAELEAVEPAGGTVVVFSADGDLDRPLRARCDAVVALAGADLAGRVAQVVAALVPGGEASPGADVDLPDGGRTGALSG